MADTGKNVESEEKNIFGQTTPIASTSRVNMIIDKTKTLAFPTGPVLTLENFESYGGGGQGYMNSIEAMRTETGKDLQESYRIGLSESASYTDKVADR
jgi:hypothetical protein